MFIGQEMLALVNYALRVSQKKSLVALALATEYTFELVML